jgi:hypothetical protein
MEHGGNKLNDCDLPRRQGGGKPARWLGFVFGCALACGAERPEAVVATGSLPPYTPEQASIFGDTLSPAVLGHPAEVAPALDPKLTPRLAAADAVLTVRVATVSKEELAGIMGYSLTVAVDHPALRGHEEAGSLEIRIGRGSPSLMQTDAYGDRLVGRRFVLFVKRFEESGEPKLHWYADVEDPALIQAISGAKPLDAKAAEVQTGR